MNLFPTIARKLNIPIRRRFQLKIGDAMPEEDDEAYWFTETGLKTSDDYIEDDTLYEILNGYYTPILLPPVQKKKEDLQLCCVDGSSVSITMYFTDDMEKVQGCDWDEYPRNPNFTYHPHAKYTPAKIEFYPYKYKKDDIFKPDAIYSVREINTGKIPWIATKWTLNHNHTIEFEDPLYAGVTYKNVISWLKEKDMRYVEKTCFS